MRRHSLLLQPLTRTYRRVSGATSRIRPCELPPSSSCSRVACNRSLRPFTANAAQRDGFQQPNSGGGFGHGTNDTIYALSTAQGKAGIAVIRISGPSCLDIYRALCPSKALPKPRYAAVRSLLGPKAAGVDRGVLDSEAVVLYFPSPKTVTGEDVLELHIHGGTATIKAVLAAIPQCPSKHRIRYAEPGEFTKRAFLNDRLDLARVESLGDILSAETEQQRRAAVRGTSGRLARTYEGWREELLLARGEIEALIDFSEDQHFDESPADLLHNVADIVDNILRGIRLHERGGQRSELLRSGIRIALLGPPNVGKSSLMNLIVGREASIVSGEAGTTRDIVEASLDIGGYLCSFADTAGFRSSADLGPSSQVGAVEREGIRRARQKAQESDIVIVLASLESGPSGPAILYDQETLDIAAAAQARLIVVNKRDTVSSTELQRLLDEFRQRLGERMPELGSAHIAAISCKEASSLNSAGQHQDPGGIHALTEAMIGTFSQMTEMPVDLQDLLGVTARQAQLLARCRGFLEEFLAEARPEDEGVEADTVLAAEYLRYAADCLARITGKGEAGDVEDVLGVVFEKFCVGK
ncbi:P-loop containing nucleoside triphosphate hydrolase protein [Trichoderma longibrachiatum ATCC 18648]|uniref:P-loop containing nucleoside triphosphate hydrolase protein n=1 Tax=Trichoderma longibrachiatum ATCC 18648 TaxID=983965 RepID=A0A2T4CAG6_TRILO|nr:P-loop containing nucleoside triphosphate hydrolase protein [Trichoderma longibrachiatum ATCC 18648]